MRIIKAGVVGAAGYTGGEMLRILLNHPGVEVLFAHSRSNAGKPVYSVHADLKGDTEMCFAAEIQEGADVLFLCVGHGEAKVLLEGLRQRLAGEKIIDLSQDFRLVANAVLGDKQFVYGLPEVKRDAITGAHFVANPGCFATAIQLALLPLAHAGMLQQVFVTGVTGSTGAGQKLQATSHFSRRTNNVEAYKTLSHQHLAEIGETLAPLNGGKPEINFIPWRGDFARGIYLSAVTGCDMPAGKAFDLYEAFYKDARFTVVSREMINLKQVLNTNKCLVYPEVVEGKLVVHAAIDNLLKGASGQAVQNMNLMFGLPEDAGLRLKSIAF